MNSIYDLRLSYDELVNLAEMLMAQRDKALKQRNEANELLAKMISANDPPGFEGGG